jgi:hypothetical protein
MFLVFRVPSSNERPASSSSTLQNKIEIRQIQVQQIERVFKLLDVVGGKPLINRSDCINQGIVLVEPLLMFNHHRLLVLHLLQKVAQGIDNVFSVDS